LEENQKIAAASRSIIADNITGAMTGPVHGAGSRKRISHVKKEAGQSINNFRKI
jgi:hypothetical protein